LLVEAGLDLTQNSSRSSVGEPILEAAEGLLIRVHTDAHNVAELGFMRYSAEQRGVADSRLKKTITGDVDRLKATLKPMILCPTGSSQMPAAVRRGWPKYRALSSLAMNQFLPL
jgi:hypothetical protein